MNATYRIDTVRGTDGEFHEIIASEYGVIIQRAFDNTDTVFIEPVELDSLIAGLVAAKEFIDRKRAYGKGGVLAITVGVAIEVGERYEAIAQVQGSRIVARALVEGKTKTLARAGAVRRVIALVKEERLT